MQAMQAPVLSHLDPDMMARLDDVRARLGRVFKADDGAFAFAVSGTGTAGMETAIANLTTPGARAVAVVTGYFGDRLAQMLARYGADVSRVDVEWGRACDPAQLEKALAGGADLVTMVHAETSTGVLNPVAEMCRIARARGARTIVDAVTSLGALAPGDYVVRGIVRLEDGTTGRVVRTLRKTQLQWNTRVRNTNGR